MKSRKNLFSFLAIVATAGLSAGYLFFDFSRKEVTLQIFSSPQLAATHFLHDAQPKISYRIMTAGGATFEGSGALDKNKQIALTAPSQNQPVNATTTYDLEIYENEKDLPAHITVILDPAAGTASLQGKGFDRFENILFGNEAQTSHVKADWAGIIHGQSDWRLDSQGEPSFKLAFFQNSNIAGDFASNPLLIKAQISVGGVRIDCSTGISICNTGHLANLTNLIDSTYIAGFRRMTEQLTAVLMEHTFIMGLFMDAKMQLETQREYQAAIAEAHRDYHPSDTMCRVGSFVKSVAASEARAAFNKEAMNAALNETYLNSKNRSASQGYALDIQQRLQQFREKYCNPRDNNDGLNAMCDHDQRYNAYAVPGDAIPTGTGVPSMAGAILPIPIPGMPPPPHPYQRMNKDIDYPRTADFPLTLDVDFTDATLTEDEEDILALARNLYWHEAGEPAPESPLAMERGHRYVDQRSNLAMQNVAHNTFLEIASMKSRSNPAFGANSGGNFMKSLLREFGMQDPEIHQLLGEYPSYYAQMEILTKKMFQNPDFYTNLYDKPANVERIGASLAAIQLMQQRDFLDSRQRMEMLNSLILENALDKDFIIINAQLGSMASRSGDK